MILEPTVFILGAGASVPYGYPTGAKLRSSICSPSFYPIYFRHYEEDDKHSRSGREEQRNLGKLISAFNQSSNYSIDIWLARNPQFIDIGKKAILSQILHAEKESRFDEDMTDENKKMDWYGYLFNRLTHTMIDPKSYSKFNDNKVGFITFNYDRSLEYFLHKSLINSFKMPNGLPHIEPQIDFSNLISIPIYHVYGVVAKLPWQIDPGLEYGKELNLRLIEILKNNIRIIHERTNKEIEDIKKLVASAKRIFFLGFGFADANLKAIGIPEVLTGYQEVYGTAFGLLRKRERKF